MRTFTGIHELWAAVGSRIGISDWMAVDQARVNLFAEATDDHQWIYVDAGQAAAGPFGGPIVHGFLTLSLLPVLADVYRVEGSRMGVNYGLNRVRFTAPVPVGSRLRAVVDLLDVADAPGGAQVTVRVTVEIEGDERPALVAEWITRRYF
jgi:acyl dehydratase